MPRRTPLRELPPLEVSRRSLRPRPKHDDPRKTGPHPKGAAEASPAPRARAPAPSAEQPLPRRHSTRAPHARAALVRAAARMEAGAMPPRARAQGVGELCSHLDTLSLGPLRASSAPPSDAFVVFEDPHALTYRAAVHTRAMCATHDTDDKENTS
ncbi:hypothetical protein MBRA1_003833 [Malassezia brasiliensis]|uniref:Uncharacterized protein n=1 Tax=Malassezia brasiliensis TaxID=1821822 RepID=A0AAF0DX83_9BASI|nr:hypothetical protein MBRA1_003833 [Malassezia brasiliensis]